MAAINLDMDGIEGSREKLSKTGQSKCKCKCKCKRRVVRVGGGGFCKGGGGRWARKASGVTRPKTRRGGRWKEVTRGAMCVRCLAVETEAVGSSSRCDRCDRLERSGRTQLILLTCLLFFFSSRSMDGYMGRGPRPAARSKVCYFDPDEARGLAQHGLACRLGWHSPTSLGPGMTGAMLGSLFGQLYPRDIIR